MNYKNFLLLVEEIKRQLIRDGVFDSKSYYALASEQIFDNRVGNYINYLNFELMWTYFKDKEINTILDLGCGIGDKSLLLKKYFPSADISGLETVNHDDPDHVKNKPHLFYESVYKKINENHDVNLSLYDGQKLPSDLRPLDIVVLYAVIEHIDPIHRKKFIGRVSEKLSPGGYIVITRCPRYWGVIEFVSRRIKLTPHKWVLKAEDLMSLLPKSEYKIEVFKRINNVPNNYSISKKFYPLLILLDKILSFLRWPFSTDYFLIAKKYENLQ